MAQGRDKHHLNSGAASVPLPDRIRWVVLAVCMKNRAVGALVFGTVIQAGGGGFTGVAALGLIPALLKAADRRAGVIGSKTMALPR